MAYAAEVLQPGRVAVITGGASGIGLASARRLAERGMRICLADHDEEGLAGAAAAIEGSLPVLTDVCDFASVTALAETVTSQLGPVSMLMNHVGTGGARDPMQDLERWHFVIQTNLFGVLHGIQAFLPAMVASGEPGIVVNTGSKQGITTPPGDTAYNVSKAGVKVATEGLQHVLRNTPGCKVSAHLLVPGWVHTGLTARQGTEKPPGAWSPDQLVDRLLERMGAGDFYIVCPDNEVSSELDGKRILWAAGDIVENRPPLSRWHPDYKDAFAEFLKA
jgi:NAD(P)-dependent dehydrogenase (short-subunit alcohol dehydrogenase family)